MELLEITTINVAYSCLGGFVVAFSMFSLLAKERILVNEVVLGTTFGICIGPYFANIFDPRGWGSDTLTLEIMRIVLATGLFAIGVELPKGYMRKHARSLLSMVVPTMAIGWIIVAGLLRVLFPTLSWTSCLLISACLTPTDPIICAAIVGGKYAKKNVPVNLRHLLSAESAANDGMAYPFLSLSVFFTLHDNSRTALTYWVLIGCLHQVVLGIILGGVLGLLFRHLMKFSHLRGFIDRESYVAQYVALALFITGIVSLLGSDDLLAVFAAGSAISWDGEFYERTEGEAFASVIDLLLNCCCFVYIGAWLPFRSFSLPELGISPWNLLYLSLGILCLRRIPALLFLYKWIPEIESWREALFSGHFGPMGVGAIFISSLALHQLGPPNDPPVTQQDYLTLSIQPIVAFIVLTSIVVHGLSIPFFNFGQTISRSRSLSVTHLRARTLSYTEWLSGVQNASTLPTDLTAQSSSSRTESSASSNELSPELQVGQEYQPSSKV